MDYQWNRRVVKIWQLHTVHSLLTNISRTVQTRCLVQWLMCSTCSSGCVGHRLPQGSVSTACVAVATAVAVSPVVCETRYPWGPLLPGAPPQAPPHRPRQIESRSRLQQSTSSIFAIRRWMSVCVVPVLRPAHLPVWQCVCFPHGGGTWMWTLRPETDFRHPLCGSVCGLVHVLVWGL